MFSGYLKSFFSCLDYSLQAVLKICTAILQLLEISGGWQQTESRLLIGATRRRMARVASGLHHRNGHPSVPHPLKGECCQLGADPSPLIIWIDGNHVDFSHAMGPMELHRDKADGYTG